MANIKFTNALKRFYPDLKPLEMEAETIDQVVHNINELYPGIKSYIVDDQGHLRKHVNIFLDGKMIDDRATLSDAVNTQSEIYIMQALSGG